MDQIHGHLRLDALGVQKDIWDPVYAVHSSKSAPEPYGENGQLKCRQKTPPS